MGGEHTFLQTVVSSLDAGLAAAGVTTVNYGLVGFGGNNSSPGYGDPVDLSSGLVGLADLQTALGGLYTSGGTEDGYEAMQFALDTYTFTGAAINFILVTDEDRDNTSADTYESILANLTSSKVVLNAVVDQDVYDSNGLVIGTDGDGTTYAADGLGSFTETALASFGYASGSTYADYTELALATGGAVWDLGILRSGGTNAESFASAFLDIKVQEVVEQIEENTPAVPLPAGLPLAATGLGALAFLRRRKG